jgi:hypothetical protein
MEFGSNIELTCYRDAELAREERRMPAVAYNHAITLLARSDNQCLFVPIRSMQYLAILDAEEFVFVDGTRKNLIDVAWQHFRPSERTSLDDPVSFQAIYYKTDVKELVTRLHTEFPLALLQLANKNQPHRPARVIKLITPDNRT